MKPLACLLLFVIVGCGLRSENSLSSDAETFATPDPELASGPQSAHFVKVHDTLKEKCSGCHAVFPAYSEKKWIEAGYVTPNSAETSPLYRALRGAGVGGKENMPLSGALSSTELALFYNWIQNMSPPN